MLQSILSAADASEQDNAIQSIPQGISDIQQARISPQTSQKREAPLEEFRSLEDAVAAYERQLIESVLQSSRSLREAGTKLGINASTVSRKIKQYGIDYPHAR